MATLTNGTARNSRLSYKFQRLREQLREAIERGEFTGRLPGERDLGRRFHANAKTINKALSDLSAEGLVVRHVGRGTYVAGSDAESRDHRARCFWWVSSHGEAGAMRPAYKAAHQHLASAGSADSLIAVSLEELTRGSESRSLRDVDGMLIHDAPMEDAMISELVRRHIPIVALGGDSDAPRVNQVICDDADAGFRLAEHLAQLGYRDIRIVAADSQKSLAERVHTGYQAAMRRRRLHSQPIVPDDGLDTTRRIGSQTGLILAGSASVQCVADRWNRPGNTERPAMCCILPPGCDLGERLGITAYETPMSRLAEWGIRLLSDVRAGQPPVQVVIPGKLVLRASTDRAVPQSDIPVPLAEAII